VSRHGFLVSLYSSKMSLCGMIADPHHVDENPDLDFYFDAELF
jgi:hypothetical protein